ncbi:MAG: sulfoxide reductase heme-binding subunit YedZ [Rhodospirillales bacterium]|nr:sulfoxide reductase heme-binding subunit YedZ [Rhodospirillales bacterium]
MSVAGRKRWLLAALLLPLVWLAAKALLWGLGANPIEAITRFLGDWALRLLILTLAITPAARLVPGLGVLRSYRRMMGLAAFFYALAHVSSYVGLDQFFDWGEIGRDIAKRTYITVGMTVFLLLLPLAVTSTDAMVRRLGGRNWKRLHRLVFPAAILACLHYFMMVKVKFGIEPALYALAVAVLLAARLVWALRGASRLGERVRP